MNIKAITMITLTALIASSSLASAGGGIVIDPSNPKPIAIPDLVVDRPNKPVIVIDPSNPKPIDIPINGGKPDIPFIPVPFNLGGNGNPAKDQTPILALACTVADPLGSTDHFWIVNSGNVALPVGLKVRYRVPATGDHGAFALPRQIAVGAKLLIPNLLHGAPDGAPCTAQIIT